MVYNSTVLGEGREVAVSQIICGIDAYCVPVIRRSTDLVGDLQVRKT